MYRKHRVLLRFDIWKCTSLQMRRHRVTKTMFHEWGKGVFEEWRDLSRNTQHVTEQDRHPVPFNVLKPVLLTNDPN